MTTQEIEAFILQVFDELAPTPPRNLMMQNLTARLPATVNRELFSQVLESMVLDGRITKGNKNFLTLN